MPNQNSPTEFEPLEIAIAARGVARLSLPELAALRKRPDARFPAGLNSQLLKHSDEQTLAGLVAVYNAIDDFDLSDVDFSQWAMIVSSRYLGRGAFAGVIDKYKTEGAWGVSVQIIPHRTSHAVASTIGLALQNEGPAIGVGGGQDLDGRAILCAATVLAGGPWSGAWLVLTGWSPELTIDDKGQPTSNSTCQAVALALTHAAEPALGKILIDRNRRVPLVAQASRLPAKRQIAAQTAAPQPNLLAYLADDPLLLKTPWRQAAGAGLEIKVAFQRLRVPPGRGRQLRLDGSHPGRAASAAPHVSSQPATTSEPR